MAILAQVRLTCSVCRYDPPPHDQDYACALFPIGKPNAAMTADAVGSLSVHDPIRGISAAEDSCYINVPGGTGPKVPLSSCACKGLPQHKLYDSGPPIIN